MKYLIEHYNLKIPYLDTLTLDSLELIIYLTIMVSSVLVFSIVFWSYRKQALKRKKQENKKEQNLQEKMNEALFKYTNNVYASKYSLFDYNKTYDWLRRNGKIEGPGKDMTPEEFMVQKFIGAGGFLILAMIIDTMINLSFLVIPIGIIGFFVPDILINVANTNDNKKMLADISSIYSKLIMQLRSNVYISDTFYDCYRMCKNPRLKYALEILNAQSMVTKNINESLDDFASKFNNDNIQILVQILKQAMVTGDTVTPLQDMQTEMRSIQKAQNIVYKEGLGLRFAIIILWIFGSLLLIILYIFIQSFGSDITSLFQLT